MSERKIIFILWIAGVLSIAYGMMWDNNFVFIPGIIMVVAGYLMTRKHLKKLANKDKDDGLIR